jgi:hypothetical protein
MIPSSTCTEECKPSRPRPNPREMQNLLHQTSHSGSEDHGNAHSGKGDTIPCAAKCMARAAYMDHTKKTTSWLGAQPTRRVHRTAQQTDFAHCLLLTLVPGYLFSDHLAHFSKGPVCFAQISTGIIPHAWAVMDGFSSLFRWGWSGGTL